MAGSWLRFILAVDQLGNNIPGVSRLLFGPYANRSEDETISSSLGKLKVEYNGTIPWRYPVAKAVDALEWRRFQFRHMVNTNKRLSRLEKAMSWRALLLTVPWLVLGGVVAVFIKCF